MDSFYKIATLFIPSHIQTFHFLKTSPEYCIINIYSKQRRKTFKYIISKETILQLGIGIGNIILLHPETICDVLNKHFKYKHVFAIELNGEDISTDIHEYLRCLHLIDNKKVIYKLHCYATGKKLCNETLMSCTVKYIDYDLNEKYL